jgi:multidrug resistance efflux pump
MNFMLNRLDPNVPDPVESRRRAAGRFVRIAYATSVFGVLAFFVIYFGRPLVYLAGPGTVSSPRYVISLPYTVQVTRMTVTAGQTVKAREAIGEVRSPEVDNIVATYMRALADLTGRQAELRIKLRASQESLGAARAYLELTGEAVKRIEAMSGASLNYRVDSVRDHALARKSVASQEAEISEADLQLVSLNELAERLHDRLSSVEQNFAGGRVVAPINGIVSTNIARVGQSLVAGTPLAEILDPDDVFVDWHIPNERLANPEVGKEVVVLFGNRRIYGKIVQILPVSAVYPGTQGPVLADRPATQIARIRFNPGAETPALNSTVYVHMHYTRLSAHIGYVLTSLFGFD